VAREFTSFPARTFPVIAVIHPQHRTWRNEELAKVMQVGRGVLIDRDPRYPHVLVLHRRQVTRKRLAVKLLTPDVRIAYLDTPLVWRKLWREYDRPADDLAPVPRSVWRRTDVLKVDFDQLAPKLFELRLIDRYFLPDGSEEGA
jgi:hypothetical protein